LTPSSRKRRTLVPISAVAIALAAASAQATVYVVTANEDMTFTPADITIHQGDAIRFENAGGLHNVHADDNRFICSLNCSTSNAPSELPWSVVVRFDRLGTIGYYCDQHGNTTSGMRGSVTVIDRVFVDGFDGIDPPG
jgi:plastocyanin